MWWSGIGCLVTLILSLLAAPLATTAQPQGKVPRVAVLEPTSQEHPAPCLPAFQQGLRDLGYVEGQTIRTRGRSIDQSFNRRSDLNFSPENHSP